MLRRLRPRSFVLDFDTVNPPASSSQQGGGVNSRPLSAPKAVAQLAEAVSFVIAVPVMCVFSRRVMNINPFYNKPSGYILFDSLFCQL